VIAEHPAYLDTALSLSSVAIRNQVTLVISSAARHDMQVTLRWTIAPPAGYWDGMDAERIIAEIERLERTFAAPESKARRTARATARGFAFASSTQLAADLMLKPGCGLVECHRPGLDVNTGVPVSASHSAHQPECGNHRRT